MIGKLLEHSGSWSLRLRNNWKFGPISRVILPGRIFVIPGKIVKIDNLTTPKFFFLGEGFTTDDVRIDIHGNEKKMRENEVGKRWGRVYWCFSGLIFGGHLLAAQSTC